MSATNEEEETSDSAQSNLRPGDHDVHVRPAEEADVSAINELIYCLDAFHAEARPDLFRKPSGAPRGKDFLKNVLQDPEQQILVAVRAGELVGYVHVVIKSAAPAEHRLERRYAEIDTICVLPAVRRLGIGQKLMKAALNWSGSRGVHDHQIEVHEFNRAARILYEQIGFVASVTLLRRKS